MPSSLPSTSDPVPTRGLIVRQPWVDHLLAGRKTWELRGKNTAIRGPIALIEGGTCTVVGVLHLDATEGPLPRARRLEAARAGAILPEEVDEEMYPNVYAWKMSARQRLTSPVPYPHPSGAVIWVSLDDDTRRRLGKAMEACVPSSRRRSPKR